MVIFFFFYLNQTICDSFALHKNKRFFFIVSKQTLYVTDNSQVTYMMLKCNRIKYEY